MANLVLSTELINKRKLATSESFLSFRVNKIEGLTLKISDLEPCSGSFTFINSGDKTKMVMTTIL